MAENDIPILMSQVIQDGTVLSHPELIQRLPLPTMERDPDIELIVPTGSVTDPNQSIDSAHILAPLFQKASLNEEAIMVSILTINMTAITPIYSPQLDKKNLIGLQNYRWPNHVMKWIWKDLT